jgi:ELWxxDGT repeat protein
MGDQLIFGGHVVDDGLGNELLAMDAQHQVRMVADINPGVGSSDPSHFATLGSRVLFHADDGLQGEEWWITDGTAQGTRLVLDIEPGAGGSAPHGLRRVGDHVVFLARTTEFGDELWTSDGTAAGTRLLIDLYPGFGSGIAFSFASGIRSPLLDANATHALFRGSPDPFGIDAGCPIFITDGTPQGTHCAQDRSLPVPLFAHAPASEARFTESGDIALFSHTSASGEEFRVLHQGREVELVSADLQPGGSSSGGQRLIVDGDVVWFGANDGLSGFELYRADLSGLTRVFEDGFE